MNAVVAEKREAAPVFRHARKNFEAGLYKLAAEELTEFIAAGEEPELMPSAKLLLAQALHQLDKTNQAASILAELLADQTFQNIHLETLYWLGECRLKQGKAEVAAGLFSQVVGDPAAGELVPAALNGLGRSYFEQKEYDRAVEVFDRIGRDYSDTAHLWAAALQKSRCLLKQEKYSESKKLLLRLMEQDVTIPYKPECFFLLGETDIYQGNHSEALVYYQMSLADTEPRRWHPEAEYGIGWSHLKMKNYEKAIAAFAKVIQDYSENPAASETLRRSKLSLGKALFMQGDYERARQVVENYIAEFSAPGFRSEAYFLLGEIYTAAGKYEAALGAFDQAADLEPGDLMLQKIHFRKAEILFATAGYDSAIGEFRKASAFENADPGLSIRADMRVGDAYIKLGSFEKGVEAFSRIIEAHPDDEEIDSVIYRLGWCYYKLRSDQEALAAFKRLTERYPHSDLADDALYRVGGVYYRRGDYEQAMKIYNRIEKEYPGTDLGDKLRYQLAKSNYNLGFFEAALGLFRDLTRKYPDSRLRQRSAYEIGWCYYQMGQTERAMEYFNSLIKENPDSEFVPEIIFWMAEYHFSKQQYAEAKRLFRKLAGSYSNHELADGALYWAGRASLEMDEPDSAMAIFKELRSRYPESDFDIDAGFQIGRILFDRKEYSAAGDYFQRLNSERPVNYLSREIELQLAGCELRRGNIEGAFTLFNALANDDKITIKARALIGRAECYYQQEQPGKAVRELMAVAWDYPDEYEIVDESLVKAAGILEGQGDISEAQNIYSMIVERNLPSSDKAEEKLKALKKRSIFGF